MNENEEFRKLIATGQPTGEVIGVNRFLITVKGLLGCTIGAMVLFETGERGIVRKVDRGTVLVLNFENETTGIGTLCTIRSTETDIPVGVGFVGRVVDVFGRPLDGEEEPKIDTTMPAFGQAPGIAERITLKDQLYTGVGIVDMMFPIVKGQRIAILGDAKSGKSAFLQMLSAQQGDTDTILVHVLIGKRRSEIDQTVNSLKAAGVMDRSIVVVADIFNSLAQSYIAPYAACAMAEYIWKETGKDVVIMYDDLTSHAKVYREISLLEEANPGRDSYPGDMFHAHSSLLERAGKLLSNGKTLSAIPVVITPGDDITAYLPTSIMSITDGQIIFDLATFRRSIRPAVNIGLSVSRVGGRARVDYQQELAKVLSRKMADYRQAQEFARFGSDLAIESRRTLLIGHQIEQVFRQLPSERYSIVQQEIMIQTVLMGEGKQELDIAVLKKEILASAAEVKESGVYEDICQRLLAKVATGKKLEDEEFESDDNSQPPTKDKSEDRSSREMSESGDKKIEVTS
ncbi:MAG: sodium-transporting two-sector ATPase [Candidatus Saccharimonadales bacterium]